MNESITFYWLPNCTTCQKAARYLEERGHKINEWRDLKLEPLGREDVARLAERVGGASELFSRRARKYRELNLHDQELSTDRMLDLMAQEYTFIKRPVLISNDRAVAGFTGKNYDRFFDEK